jgi:ATP-dependent protease ClpP protease subunit
MMPDVLLLPEFVRPHMQRAMEGVRPERVQWFEIRNAADGGAPHPETTEVVIYDEIGGWCGVSPAAFRRALKAIETPRIDVRIHSPGGNAFDGIAIYNAIRQHPAYVTAYVDGLAASAASFIALGADEVVMSEAAQIMIHDAWGVVVGPADDLTDVAEQLNKISNNIARVYAKKSGGTVEEWRAAMKKESWYTDDEAVEAGLADRIDDGRRAAPVKAQWNLSVFMYGGRNAAIDPEREPAPQPPMPAGPVTRTDKPSRVAASKTVTINASNRDMPPVAPKVSPADAAAKIHRAPVSNRSDGPTNPEGSTMDSAKLREALGLAADADDDAVRNALASSGFSEAPPADPPTPPTMTVPDTATLAAMADGDAAVLVDPAQLRSLRESAAKGERAFDKMRRDERDTILSKAVKDGKFPPERLQHWMNLWDKDPEGTRAAVDRLAPNVIPVLSAGYAASLDEVSEADMAYKGLYPEG